LENWSYPAIYDTGTSLMYAPGGLGKELMLRLAKGSEYLFDSSSGLMIVNCDEKANYQDFYLTIDGYQFKVLADDYFFSFTAEEDILGTGATEATCFLGIISEPTVNYWLMGDVFLTGYYSIFDNSDHDNARIGFAPHATSSKPNVDTIATSSLPTTRVDDIMWELSWLFNAW